MSVVSQATKVTPSSPTAITDKLWQQWVFWAEPVSDDRQSVIKYRVKRTTGKWDAIKTVNLGESMKAVEPFVTYKGRTIVLYYRGIDRLDPYSSWQIRDYELIDVLPE